MERQLKAYEVMIGETGRDGDSFDQYRRYILADDALIAGDLAIKLLPKKQQKVCFVQEVKLVVGYFDNEHGI